MFADVPVAPVMEGFVILKPNPNYKEPKDKKLTDNNSKKEKVVMIK